MNVRFTGSLRSNAFQDLQHAAHTAHRMQHPQCAWRDKEPARTSRATAALQCTTARHLLVLRCNSTALRAQQMEESARLQTVLYRSQGTSPPPLSCRAVRTMRAATQLGRSCQVTLAAVPALSPLMPFCGTRSRAW